MISSYPAAERARGSVTQRIDTGKDSFVRTQVLDSSGTLIGLSNHGLVAPEDAAGRHPGPAPGLRLSPGAGSPRPGRAGRGRSRGRYPPPATWVPPRYGSPPGCAGSAG